jgi:hypothetical protein
MVLPVWDFKVLQKRDLDVDVSQLASAFPQFRDQLEGFLLISAFRRKCLDYGFNPATVGAKPVHVFRRRALGNPPDVPIHAVKNQPALILRNTDT